jgi:hypothetical protein
MPFLTNTFNSALLVLQPEFALPRHICQSIKQCLVNRHWRPCFSRFRISDAYYYFVIAFVPCHFVKLCSIFSRCLSMYFRLYFCLLLLRPFCFLKICSINLNCLFLNTFNCHAVSFLIEFPPYHSTVIFLLSFPCFRVSSLYILSVCGASTFFSQTTSLLPPVVFLFFYLLSRLQ